MTILPRATPAPARSIGALVAAVFIALAAMLFGPAGAASAHDELVATDPAADAVLSEAPASLTLTFSAELLPAQGATEVQVSDASGAALADGEPVVAGSSVTQAVQAGSGVYTVLWRAVSSDGHPISGEYSFTVDAPAPAPTATPSESASPSTEPEATEAPTPTASETAAPVTTEDGAEDAAAISPWIIGTIVAVIVTGAVVYLLVARARRAGDAGAAPKTDSAPRTGR